MNLFASEWAVHVVEIGGLLLLTNYVLALVRHTLGDGWIRLALGRHDTVGLVCGAMVGAVTPVCSCSVGAIYASLVQNGASPRAAAAFLFAAPAINEVVLIAVILTLGWQGAVVYLAAGLTAAVLTGRFAESLHLRPCLTCSAPGEATAAGWPAWRLALADTTGVARRMALPVLAGAGVAGLMQAMHIDPTTVLTGIGAAPWAPIAAAVLALPIHIEPALVSGLVLPLAASGLALGTLISLTMAATVASVPEAVVLRTLVGWRGVGALSTWFLVYTSGIGLLVNTLHA